MPLYEFTLSTGDYPLVVKTNGYLTDYLATSNTVDNGNGNTGNLDYTNTGDNTLRLTKSNFKTYKFDETLGKDVADVNSGSTTTSEKGKLTINFSGITNNIIDSEISNLGIIGDSTHGYALNAKYFYIAFIEFIFVKQYFDAYLICDPNVENNPDSMFKFSFIDSDQTTDDFRADYKTQMINIDSEGIVNVNSSSGLVNDTALFGDLSSTPKAIYTDDGTGTNKGKARLINSLSRTIENTTCYSYACVYGIYIDPLAYFSKIKNGTLDTLNNVTLELTFDFYLCDNVISYPYTGA